MPTIEYSMQKQPSASFALRAPWPAGQLRLRDVRSQTHGIALLHDERQPRRRGAISSAIVPDEQLRNRRTYLHLHERLGINIGMV